MRSSTLAGAGLGLVAAVVFASATTGPLIIRFFLLFITPLAIALAGLGWGWRAGVLAGTVGTAIVALFAGPTVALAFALTQVVPMVLLTYLALLSRPISESGDDGADDGSGLEWYPVGRMVLWAAGMSAVMAIGSMILLGGGDLESLRQSLSEVLQAAFSAGLEQANGQIGEAELAALSELALAVLPAASAMSWMASLLFNLWLGGRVTRASGQLDRSWPDLAAFSFPPGTALAFGAALLATMVPGYPGLAASAAAGGLFAAYFVLGLAVVHYATRGKPWRLFALWALYASILILNIWMAIVIAVVGLAETALQLRARAGVPPLPPTDPNS